MAKRAFLVGVLIAACALVLTGCPATPPPAYPAVRYESEPFPPPDPRSLLVDGGSGPERSGDAGAR
jgi:hypothetical protein